MDQFYYERKAHENEQWEAALRNNDSYASICEEAASRWMDGGSYTS